MKRNPAAFLFAIFFLLNLLACAGGTTPGNPGTSGASVAPMITTEPTSQTVTAGQTANFTVAATGTAPLSYQWQNAATQTNITGATSSNYSISNTTTAQSAMTFRVIVSNGVNPPATSNIVTLTVNPASAAPSITTQPMNQTVTAGQTASFSVAAAGTAPLSYQWQMGTTNIAGAPNSPSYTTPMTTTANSGETFRVIVSNGVNPPATSNMAMLTVNPAPVAPSITTQPMNQTVTAGQTATFTVAATGTMPLSYQWLMNGANIAAAPNSPSYTTPVTTTANSGETFQVIVSNGVNPPATSNMAMLTVNPAPVAPSITTQPTNQSVTAGQIATFSVAATGTAPLSYQWQMGTTNIAGAPNSPSYTTPMTTTANSGETFRVIVSNGVNPPATSNAATLTVTAAPVAPSITTQPTNETVTAGQTATFSVVATGTAPLSYQWQSMPGAANIAGATSSSYSIANTTTAESGSQFQVVVSNGVSPPATSNTVTLTVNAAAPPNNIAVLTYHNDVSRTGQNLNETALTTASVASAQFGQLGTIAVDGAVDAEPLYVGGMTINGAMHNVLLVVTENDSVYAFDADSFTQLWHNAVLSGTSETAPTAGSNGSQVPCAQVKPSLGITSTPVIDLSSGPNGTIFVVALSIDTGGNFHHRLHAIDLGTGLDEMAATEIQATGFSPSQYEERSALLLSNSVIYLAWTSHCDDTPYNAWVMGYSESSLQQVSTINLTPSGIQGGIWMAGDGLAADSSGNIYFLDGNGTFDTSLTNGFPSNGNYGNGFIKLTTANNSLAVADYFEMFDTVTQTDNDRDLGSGGLVLLPDMQDSSGTTRQLAVGAGKADFNSGNVMLYVVDRNNMGKFNPASDTGIYQELSSALLGGQGCWSAPAFFNNTLYFAAVGDHLRAIPISQAMVASSSSSNSSGTFGYPGASPSISANGSTIPPTNGIVWAIQSSTTLTAFDATNLANQLFTGSFSGNGSTKFITPMIANGKVYVGTGPTNNNQGSVVVFGLSSQAASLVRKPRPAHDHHRSLPPPKQPHSGSSTPAL